MPFRSRLKALFPLGPLLLCSLLLHAQGSLSEDANPSKFYKNNRELVALARLRKEKNVVVLIAAKPGKCAEVAEAMGRAGGEVHYRADEVDYLRGRLPVDQVMALAHSPDVESLDIDVDFNRWSAARDSFEDPDLPSSNPPDPDTPLSHPYMPQKDMDIVAFQTAHPTYDGRGVNLALLDATPDMLLPELQEATSLNGAPVRKVSEVLASSDPRDDIDPMWVKMDTIVHVKEGKFEANGITYAASPDGDYRFAVFDERALETPAYLHQDVNFDGNPEGSSGLFGVLWDERTGTVWVDTNQDHDFRNEHGLQEYSKHGDIGIFGSGRSKEGRRHSVGFAVQLNPEQHAVRLTLGVWQHVTEVSGAAVGKGFFGGTYDGIAGGAQLASYFTGDGSLYRRVESVIDAARNPRVDVICLEPSILDIVLNPLHDGRLVAGVIFDRVTLKYKKPLLSPADNTFGMTTVMDEVSGRGILAVGAYQNGDAYRINNGADVEHKDNLHLVGSFGPSGNGSLKPDIISPSELISTEPGYKVLQKVKGVYELPAGYFIAGGTSTAGPSASAAVALLISAAKQAHVAYDAERIRTAVLSSARFLPSLQAYQQGNGLVQVNAAWTLLQQLNDRWEPLAITSTAPVHTASSAELRPANTGPGIFEREGWKPGQTGTRVITFRRASGPTKPVSFDLEWVGNHGEFASAASITLPLNQPVELPIQIDARHAGPSSAILNLRRPGYPGIAYQVLNTIVAAPDLGPENGYTSESHILAERPGVESIFVRVPSGAPALRIRVTTPKGSKDLRVMAFAPDLAGDVDYAIGLTQKGLVDKVVDHPAPGVWEVELWGNQFVFDPKQIDSHPLSAIPTDLSVSVVGASAPSVERASASGSNDAFRVHFRNDFSALRASAHTSALGSEWEHRAQIREGDQKDFEINVPQGTDRLTVRLTKPEDPGADLDLYLYQSLEGTTVLRRRSDRHGAEEVITVDHPAAGKWTAVVDAFYVPRGTTMFTYQETYFDSAFGSVEVVDPPAVHASGSEWTAEAHLHVLARPVEPRQLVEDVPVEPDEVEGEPVLSDVLAHINDHAAEDPASLGEAVLPAGN